MGSGAFHFSDKRGKVHLFKSAYQKYCCKSAVQFIFIKRVLKNELITNMPQKWYDNSRKIERIRQVEMVSLEQPVPENIYTES